MATKSENESLLTILEGEENEERDFLSENISFDDDEDEKIIFILIIVFFWSQKRARSGRIFPNFSKSSQFFFGILSFFRNRENFE